MSVADRKQRGVAEILRVRPARFFIGFKIDPVSINFKSPIGKPTQFQLAGTSDFKVNYWRDLLESVGRVLGPLI